MVYEYSPLVPHDQFVLMGRSQFEDGRYRVVSHPDHREKIEKALQSLDEQPV